MSPAILWSALWEDGTSCRSYGCASNCRNSRYQALVVGGDQDTTVGVESMLADYLALPAARRFLHIYHGVGHSPNVEAPQELAALLRAFVDRVAAMAAQEAVSTV